MHMANHINRFSTLNQPFISHLEFQLTQAMVIIQLKTPGNPFVNFWNSLSTYVPLLQYFLQYFSLFCFFFCLIHSVRTHIPLVISSLDYHPESIILPKDYIPALLVPHI